MFDPGLASGTRGFHDVAPTSRLRSTPHPRRLIPWSHTPVSVSPDFTSVVRTGRKNAFVAEVVRLPTFGELAARILTTSVTDFLEPLLVFCKPVLAPVRTMACGETLRALSRSVKLHTCFLTPDSTC